MYVCTNHHQQRARPKPLAYQTAALRFICLS